MCCWRARVLPIFVIGIAALTLLSSLTPGSAVGGSLPSYAVQLRSEANDGATRLSSGNPAGPGNPAMPLVDISFTARCLLGPDPVGGQTVEFFEDPATAGHLTLTDPGVTGENGRCNTVVRAIPGTTPVDGFETAVVARWRVSETLVFEKKRCLYLRAYTPTTEETAAAHAPLPNGPLIRVQYAPDIGVMRKYCDRTNEDWDEPNRLDFIDNPAWQIWFRWDYDPLSPNYAETGPPGESNQYTITYNMYQLDGNWPTPDGSLGPPYPALSSRHHVYNTANHEVGHALGFGHNGGSLSSLMTPSALDSYLTWKKEVYQAPQESVPLLLWYPPQ